MMCIDGLTEILKMIDELRDVLNEKINELKTYRTYRDGSEKILTWRLPLLADLKMLCLTKIKRCDETCIDKIYKLIEMENSINTRYKNKLTKLMDQMFDDKQKLGDGLYLELMDEMMQLNMILGLMNGKDE